MKIIVQTIILLLISACANNGITSRESIVKETSDNNFQTNTLNISNENHFMTDPLMEWNAYQTNKPIQLSEGEASTILTLEIEPIPEEDQRRIQQIEQSISRPPDTRY